MESSLVVARGYGRREGMNIKQYHGGAFWGDEIILYHNYGGGYRCYAYVIIYRTSHGKKVILFLNIKNV